MSRLLIQKGYVNTGDPICPECGSVAEQGTGTHHFCFHEGGICVDFEWDPDTGFYLHPRTRQPVKTAAEATF